MTRRAGLPFGVRVHLSSAEIARVRSRFWRPPTRAPHVVGAGDLGQLTAPERRIVWYAEGGIETARLLARELSQVAAAWFALFENPDLLKERLYARAVPLVDDCTTLELLLSEFDPYEARNYLRLRVKRATVPEGPIDEPSGFELTEDRLAPITAYYRL
jgi:hypothetical protein